ncbi:unnamed protein product [Rhizophagus irregularis]|nr:unnamed protein product [Rhizophagus irregularis]
MSSSTTSIASTSSTIESFAQLEQLRSEQTRLRQSCDQVYAGIEVLKTSISESVLELSLTSDPEQASALSLEISSRVQFLEKFSPAFLDIGKELSGLDAFIADTAEKIGADPSPASPHEVDYATSPPIVPINKGSRNHRSYEFPIRYSFLQSPPIKRYVGSNTLYNTRKGNTYLLLDTSKKDCISVLSNNKRMVDSYATSPYSACSECRRLHEKISVHPASFARKISFEKRMAKPGGSNRETSTFIKFSYKHTSFYLGFYVPCSFCHSPCAVVMSDNRCACPIHKHDVISLERRPVDYKNLWFKNKPVSSQRLGVESIRPDYTLPLNQLKTFTRRRLRKFKQDSEFQECFANLLMVQQRRISMLICVLIILFFLLFFLQLGSS